MGLAIGLLGGWTVTACAQAERDTHVVRETRYACVNGASFSARFMGDKVQILTRSGSYRLSRRPSSVGTRYGSDKVAFMQDEERAVLVGTEDGPYRGCVETAARPDAA